MILQVNGYQHQALQFGENIQFLYIDYLLHIQIPLFIMLALYQMYLLCPPIPPPPHCKIHHHCLRHVCTCNTAYPSHQTHLTWWWWCHSHSHQTLSWIEKLHKASYELSLKLLLFPTSFRTEHFSRDNISQIFKGFTSENILEFSKLLKFSML